MNTATIAALLNAALSFLPSIPELINGFNTAIDLLKNNRAPTASEQATIDAALDAAHAALQAAQPAAS